jgi:hypothetical protein
MKDLNAARAVAHQQSSRSSARYAAPIVASAQCQADDMRTGDVGELRIATAPRDYSVWNRAIPRPLR